MQIRRENCLSQPSIYYSFLFSSLYYIFIQNVLNLVNFNIFFIYILIWWKRKKREVDSIIK